MKSLKALCAVIVGKGGDDIGFQVKSLKTKKVMEVVSKTSSGSKFVLELIMDGKGNKVAGGTEFVVSGDEARYELFSANSGRITELEAAILKLETQRDNLEAEIDELNEELNDLEEVI